MPGFTHHSPNSRVPNVCLVHLLDILNPLTCLRHQWIFLTDTVDAVFRPDDWSPEAMFDQLAEIVGSLPIPDPRVSLPQSHPLSSPPYRDIHHVAYLAGAHATKEWPRHVSVHHCFRQPLIDGRDALDAAAHAEHTATNRLCPRSEILLLPSEHLDIRERVCQWGKCRLGGCGTRVVGGYVRWPMIVEIDLMAYNRLVPDYIRLSLPVTPSFFLQFRFLFTCTGV